MVTNEQIKNVIQRDIESELTGIRLFEAFKKATAKFDGKKITKAIATAFEKELNNPSYTVSYVYQYGMFYIYVWSGPNQIPFNERIVMHLGYGSDPVFHIGESSKQHSGVNYYCNSIGDAAKERNAQRLSLLNDSKAIQRIVDTLNNYTKAKEALDEMDSITNPSVYSILRAAEIK